MKQNRSLFCTSLLMLLLAGCNTENEKLDQVWKGYTGYPGNTIPTLDRKEVKGQMLKEGTVPSSALATSVEGRLPAYLACYDFVMVIEGVDGKADMCVYYIDNPTRDTYAVMWRGRKYLADLEQKMAGDGFSENK